MTLFGLVHHIPLGDTNYRISWEKLYRTLFAQKVLCKSLKICYNYYIPEQTAQLPYRKLQTCSERDA